jgi:hypothetical protein
MATPLLETVVVAEEIANLLDDIDGLRVFWYVSDLVRPPAAVVGQPDIDYADPTSSFCAAVWSFPITVVVARGNDRDAQTQMSRLLHEMVQALATEVPGVFSIEPVSARPITVSIGQQELPGYVMEVRVRA